MRYTCHNCKDEHSTDNMVPVCAYCFERGKQRAYCFGIEEGIKTERKRWKIVCDRLRKENRAFLRATKYDKQG